MSNSIRARSASSSLAGMTHVKLRSLLLAAVFVVLLLQNIFQGDGSEVAYLDEATTVGLFAWAVVSRPLESDLPRRRTMVILFVALFAFIALAFAGNYWYGIQSDRSAILVDAFSSVRFFVCFYSVLRLTRNDPEVLLLFQRIARVALLVFGVFMVANFLFDIGVSFELRYGIRAYSFFYQHPTMLSAAVVACASLLMPDIERNSHFILIASAVLISTLRSRSIAFAVIVIAVLVYFRHREKISFLSGMVIAMLAFAVGYTQLETYFGGEQTARSALLTTSFTVATRFFPLGSGFATYGSNASLSHYSPLYEEVGFTQIYGLSRENSQYLVDSFWPIVIGQGGWFSLLAVLTVVLAFFFDVLSLSNTRHVLVWAAVTVPAYMTISSLSEASFFSAYSPLIGLAAAVSITSIETGRGVGPSTRETSMHKGLR